MKQSVHHVLGKRDQTPRCRSGPGLRRRIPTLLAALGLEAEALLASARAAFARLVASAAPWRQ
jgi:hypothetical protein